MRSGEETRTPDLRRVEAVLYQLSYTTALHYAFLKYHAYVEAFTKLFYHTFRKFANIISDEFPHAAERFLGLEPSISDRSRSPRR